MIRGTLKSGFEFEIPESARDNMELVDAIADMQYNPLGISKVTKMLLGDDQRRRLYDHLRTEAGNVPVAAVSDAITEIFLNSGREVKN